MVGVLAVMYFTPTEKSMQNLLKEGKNFMKEKVLKCSQTIFLIIYLLFSIALFLSQLKYTHSVKFIVLFVFIALFIGIIIKFKKYFRKILNKKVFFIVCICIGITLRIALLFLNYPKLTGVGDYQTFFHNAKSFCETGTIAQPTYIALFPFLMPYIVILGSFFKIAKISYFSVILLNIILDLIIPLFLYFSFNNKPLAKCISVSWLINPINIIWCTICCPVVLVNFGISASIFIFSKLIKNINSKRFIIYSILTGIVIGFSNSFRPIMPIMLIAILLYYIYINLKNKKFNKDYLISFILIILFFVSIRYIINISMNKVNGQEVSKTSGWTLYLGSNLDSNRNLV